MAGFGGSTDQSDLFADIHTTPGSEAAGAPTDQYGRPSNVGAGAFEQSQQGGTVGVGGDKWTGIENPDAYLYYGGDPQKQADWEAYIAGQAGAAQQNPGVLGANSLYGQDRGLDYSDRSAQQQALYLDANAANGLAPSVAQEQMRLGLLTAQQQGEMARQQAAIQNQNALQASQAAAASQAASARGGGTQLALAQRNAVLGQAGQAAMGNQTQAQLNSAAAMQQAQLQQQAVIQAAALRAQEMEAARAQYGQMAGQLRGADQSRGQLGLQAGLQQQQINNQQQQYYTGLIGNTLGAENANQQAGEAAAHNAWQQHQQFQNDVSQYDQGMTKGYTVGTVEGAGSLLQTGSDARMKTGIQPTGGAGVGNALLGANWQVSSDVQNKQAIGDGAPAVRQTLGAQAPAPPPQMSVMSNGSNQLVSDGNGGSIYTGTVPWQKSQPDPQFRSDAGLPGATSGQNFNPGETAQAPAWAPGSGGMGQREIGHLGTSGSSVQPAGPAPITGSPFQNRAPRTGGNRVGTDINVPGPSVAGNQGAVRVLGAGTYGTPSTGAGAAASMPFGAGVQQRATFGAGGLRPGQDQFYAPMPSPSTTQSPTQGTDFGGAVPAPQQPQLGARVNLPQGTPPIVSDRDTKTAHEGEGDVEATLGGMHPYTYEYKEPEKFGYGPRIGVMAQDIEKGPLGNQIVRETPEGKVIDGPKGLSLALAGAANHEKRIRDIESRLGARRG